MSPNEFLERLRQEWEDRGGAGQHGKLPSVRLDWEEYFRRFCLAHGGAKHPPLMRAGRLWFEDGWGYSATDHAGPEWPPPTDEDELVRVRRVYWKLRRSAVRRELLKSRLLLEELERLVASHDVLPVQAVATWEEDERHPHGGRWHRQHREVDVGAMRSRVEWLREDLVICEFKIADPDWEPADEPALQGATG